MTTKKILCITGTRADFGKLKPLLAFLEQSPNFELHLIITGMHMMRVYGHTYHEVLREHYQNYYLLSNQTQNEAMSDVLGNSISLFSRLAQEIKPDMMMVHGDRLEALAGATVGALNNCLVCHIEGGELSGTIDDSIRHAVSKLSHLHLVANQQAAKRLMQLGESEQSIKIIGSPDLDIMQSTQLPSLDEVKRYYEIDFEQYAVSMFHPVTSEELEMEVYAKQYFQALEQSGLNIVAIYPNNDTGTQFIQAALKEYTHSPHFRIFPSIRFEYFLVLLRHAKMIIGNSSAGIREAPVYGTPTVNVGTRQQNRHFGPSIIHTSYETKDILQAISQATDMQSIQPDHTFHNHSQESSVERFIQVMNQESTWQIPTQKRFMDQ